MFLLMLASGVINPIDPAPQCGPGISREAKQVGAPLLHRLDRLPPASGYRAVYFTVDRCMVPVKVGFDPHRQR